MNTGRHFCLGVVTVLLAFAAACSSARPEPTAAPAAASTAPVERATPAGPGWVHRMQVTDMDGKTVSLGDYKGKVVLIVNTASECGLTPQYAGLQTLQETYASRGFTVLGFPCNDFGGQEPGSHEQIKAFCSTKYGVTFPLFAKVSTKGPDKTPLYKVLTEELPESQRGEIKWNFTKFLVDQQGNVVARFEPRTEPLSDEVTAAIERLLGP